MNKMLSVFLIVSFSSLVYADCIGPEVNGSCLGVNAYGSSGSDDYQGSSGSTYQYDLNNGSDRNRYSTDLDAQRRDQMDLGAGNLDHLRGQNGGGIRN